MKIRKANVEDLSRIAEIYVFNNRINYYPIFKDEVFSFDELQVITLIDYFKKEEVLQHVYVLDNGIILGFLQMRESEICKLYVEPCFQGHGFGDRLITYAIDRVQADCIWALEKNTRAIAFYQRHGFRLTGKKEFEEGTTEYLLELRLKQ